MEADLSKQQGDFFQIQMHLATMAFGSKIQGLYYINLFTRDHHSERRNATLQLINPGKA